jgi:hypothetical protein
MNRSEQTDETALLERLAATPGIFAAIAAESGTELQVQTRLREQFPAELVRMALDVADLRRRGEAKFSRAGLMWFSRTGLEQATPEVVARHKAQRFARGAVSAAERRKWSGRSAGVPVWDLCCGIGSDAIALAALGPVMAVDRDPAACLRTRLNAAVYGVADRIETHVADVRSLPEGPMPTGVWVHIDPDRRTGRGRARRLEQFSPDLAWLQELTRTARGGGIKVSPASNFGGKFPDAEIELISLAGECKEATIWFGELRGEPAWRATVLPKGESIAGHPLDAPTTVQPPGTYVFDPDPAVVRAGLVDLLASRLGLWRLDQAEEYLSGDAPVDSPFVVPFEIREVLPGNETAVRRAVRQAGLGSVEIKCRHVPLNVDALRRRLPLHGKDNGVLIYARLQGKTRVLLCRRLSRSPRPA